MSGHSKWANIKTRKTAQDAKKANAFTKMAKDISVAARGGGDPEMNFSLRLAIEKARAVNMPKENIERAIKRGTGELKDAEQIDEVIYEAYGPGQIAMLIKVATDNKNRTLSEIKSLLQKNGGKFVEGGGISWQFEQVGSLLADGESKKEEEMEMAIIESGAKDYEKEDDGFRVYTQPQDLKKVKETVEAQSLKIKEAALFYLAKNKISADEKTLQSYEGLLEVLDEHDDVVEIWDNLE